MKEVNIFVEKNYLDDVVKYLQNSDYSLQYWVLPLQCSNDPTSYLVNVRLKKKHKKKLLKFIGRKRIYMY